MKSSKTFCFLVEHPGAVPVFAELGPAAQVGDRIDAAVLHPEKHAAAESRSLRDVEAAVAIQQGGVLAVLLNSLLADDKHRNFRAVPRAVPNLLDSISRRIDGRRIDFGPERAFYIVQINAIDRRWHGEGMESEKDFVAIIPAGGAENTANGGQRNVGELLAVEPEKIQFRSRVVLILCQQLAAGHACQLQHCVRLRDEFLPVFPLSVGRVGDKDAIVGRIFVAGDIEFAGKEIGAVKEILAGSDFDGRIFRLEILQIHLRHRPTFANINQQPAVVFRESYAGPTLRGSRPSPKISGSWAGSLPSWW